MRETLGPRLFMIVYPADHVGHPWSSGTRPQGVKHHAYDTSTTTTEHSVSFTVSLSS